MKHTKTIAIGLMLFVSSLSYGQPSSNVEMPTEKLFYIQSAINYGANTGGYWDIPGQPDPVKDGSNIQVWTLDGGWDRKYMLLNSSEAGFYEIRIGKFVDSRVDVDNGKTANGTNIKTWSRNGNPAQRFSFVHLGNGRFKIYDRNGKAICLAGRSSKNGSNVHIWNDHDGSWMEWYLVDPKTGKAFIPDSKPIAKPVPTPRPEVKPAPGKTSPQPQVMPTKR
jgi:hypothetical protein